MVSFNLSFRYAETNENVLENAAGHIEKGQCAVLCGKSGCGKSTLMRCINHLIPQFYEGELKGFVLLNGQNIENLSIGETGEIVSSVFQDPRSQFFTLNSSGEVAFGLENFGFSHEDMVKKVNEAFSLFGLEKLKDRKVAELSGGERQLIAILSAWAVDTDILLLDEPTANLDFAAIKAFGKLMKELKAKGKTILINEHRLHYMMDFADVFFRMEKGKIADVLSADEMKKMSRQEQEKLGLRTTDLSSIHLEKRKNCAASDRKFSFETKKLSFRYGKNEVLRDIDFKASGGEVIAVAGSNGCGKTTFGKCITGLLKNHQGHILINGKEAKQKELISQTLFIMQEAEFQFFTDSVLHELEYGIKMNDDIRDQMEKVLRDLDMWEVRNHHPFTLSGGQMQKLTLMNAYFSPKPVVVLDEPTAGMDEVSLQKCGELILKMQKNKLVLIITHDLELIAKVCSRCICIQKGKIKGDILLNCDEDLNAVRCCMDSFSLTENERIKEPAKKHLTDPRTQLLFSVTAFFLAAAAPAFAVSGMMTALLILAAAEKEWKILLWYGSIFALVLIPYLLSPMSVMAFFMNLIPRMMLVFVSLTLLLHDDGAERTLAALRKLHVPEKAIMVCAVVFRFFPVLNSDLSLMKQSVKTRGMFCHSWEKLKALPSYLEILIVPMALRVIRIAEALAASAETRGIALKRKRKSYIEIKLTAMDGVMCLCLAVLLTIGFLQ